MNGHKKRGKKMKTIHKKVKKHKKTGKRAGKIKRGKTKKKEENKVPSYYLKVKSEFLPFVLGKTTFKEVDSSNKILEDFIKLVEKKFDAIWYLGTDYLGDELYERFMFHHGGFMEISLRGEVNCFFFEDKIADMRRAILHACEKLVSKASAMHLAKHIKTGQKLISLDNSLTEIEKGVK